MKCEEALILLSGHIDGQNTAEEELQLQEHLQACASCRKILKAYEEIDAGVAALEEEPPEALMRGVMDTIEANPARRRQKRRFWLGSGAAVAAAVLLLLVGTGRLPDFRQSRAAAGWSSKEEPAQVQDYASGQQEAAADAAAETMPYVASAEPVPAADSIPETAESAEDATVSTATEEEILTVLIVDDPVDPAAVGITELSDMEQVAAEEDGGVRYCADAAAVREVVYVYEWRYGMVVPDGLDSAADDAPCAIEIVEP